MLASLKYVETSIFVREQRKNSAHPNQTSAATEEVRLITWNYLYATQILSGTLGTVIFYGNGVEMRKTFVGAFHFYLYGLLFDH